MDGQAGITGILGTERTMDTSRAGWGAPVTTAVAAGLVLLMVVRELAVLREHTVLMERTALRRPRVLTARVNRVRRRSSKGRNKEWGAKRYHSSARLR